MLSLSFILYLKNLVSFEGFIIPVISLMSSFGPVTALANLGTTLQNTIASGKRVIDIIEETPETEDIFGKEEISFGNIKCKDLNFSYNKTPVLNNINLLFEKNKITGIVGKSGSGKSTLLKLLMRFWKSTSGEISISGKDIEEINTSNLRSMESYMTQETHLFKGTISDNIRIAKLNASQEEIQEACKKASIHSFIMTLPLGYNTELSEFGSSLSGGERQRIGLARIFLHNTDCILLDEPTSNLDTLNEAIILKSLKEEAKEKTVILVSHRKSTVRIADKLFQIEKGQSL